MMVSLAWAGRVAQAKEPSKPLLISKARFQSVSTNQPISQTHSAEDSLASSSTVPETPVPVPVQDASASSSATPSPTASPVPTATPTPESQSSAKQLALGFIDLFKKSGPTDSSSGGNTGLGLNVLSAGTQHSLYADGSGMSAAATRSAYGIVLALCLVGAGTILYDRSKHPA